MEESPLAQKKPVALVVDDDVITRTLIRRLYCKPLPLDKLEQFLAMGQRQQRALG